jgi:hypothetical protein
LRSLYQFHSKNIYFYVLICSTLKDMVKRNLRENDPSCTLKRHRILSNKQCFSAYYIYWFCCTAVSMTQIYHICLADISWLAYFAYKQTWTMSDINSVFFLMQHQVLFLSMNVEWVKSQRGNHNTFSLYIGVKCMCALWSLMVTVLSGW